MSDTEVHGPIDYLVVEFPDGSATEGPARALADLVDRGIVRLYDLALVTRTPSGDVVAVEMDAGVDDGGAFSSFAGARSGLLDGDDLVEAADLLTPGSGGRRSGSHLATPTSTPSASRPTPTRWHSRHSMRRCHRHP